MTKPAVLWQQLQQAGLVSGPLPAPADQQQQAFFLRLLLGLSGWLSAVFFTGFISVFFINVFSTIGSIWMVGLLLCLLSVVLSHRTYGSILLQQFVFACSLAGQAQIVLAVLDNSQNQQLAAATALLLAMLLFFLIRLRSHRSLSAFLACAALFILLRQQAWLYAFPALCAAVVWLWLQQMRLHQSPNLLQPAASGLTLAVWLAIYWALLINSSFMGWWNLEPKQWQSQLWIAAALSSMVCFAFAWQLIGQSIQQAKLRYLALLVSLAVSLLNLKMLGLAPLCLLLTIGIAHTQTRLIWFNLCCLAAYLMLYYYSLNHTLLYKSIVLSFSGALLLMLYVVLNHFLRQQTDQANSHA